MASGQWRGWWVVLLSMVSLLGTTDAASRFRRSGQPKLNTCDKEPSEPCVLERNPPNARVPLSDVYDLYACAAAGNAKVEGEVRSETHVLAVFFAPDGVLKVDVTKVVGAEAGKVKVKLVVMSHDAVHWQISTTDPNIEIASLDVYNPNRSTVLVGNNAEFPHHWRPKYYGFGRSKSKIQKLRHYLRQRGLGEIASFSGSVTASNWTLSVGKNYECKKKLSENHHYCRNRAVGFHGNTAQPDCSYFVFCTGKNHSNFEMRCLDGLKWDDRSHQCLEESVAAPCNGTSAECPRLPDTVECVKSEHCWAEYPFKYNKALTPCHGRRFIRYLCAYKLYVGVVLCNETTYTILLGNSETGDFLPIGDERGHGEDHCEFIGGSTIQSVPRWNLWGNTTDGYYRSNWGEAPKLGRIGLGNTLREWTGRYHTDIYNCDLAIPGNLTTDKVPVKFVDKPLKTQNVTKGDRVTLECKTNYPEAKVEWHYHKKFDRQNKRRVQNGNGLELSTTGSTLTITHFDGGRHEGIYVCSTTEPKAESEKDDTIWPETTYSMELIAVENICKNRPNTLTVSSGGKSLTEREIEAELGKTQRIICTTHGATSYKWFKDDERLRVDTDTLVIECFNDTDVGEYECRAWFPDDCYMKQTFSLLPKGCGKSSGNGRLIGGETVSYGEAPWMVVLRMNGFGRFCGGVLLNDRWIATAAHCVDNRHWIKKHKNTTFDHTRVTIYLGYVRDGQDNEPDEEPFKTITPKAPIIHSNYNSETLDNDIALLELETPVKVNISENIVPTCLHSKYWLNDEFLEPKGNGIVFGWGRTERGLRDQSDALEKLSLPVVECSTSERRTSEDSSGVKLTNNMFCAGDDTNKDTCDGDSGGPFVMQYNRRSYLLGLVSWGPVGCTSGRTYFTKVPNYVTWIREQISKGQQCQN